MPAQAPPLYENPSAPTEKRVDGLPAEVPAWAAAMGIVMSVGVGLFFGIWPANKAAQLDSVVVLQSDKA